MQLVTSSNHHLFWPPAASEEVIIQILCREKSLGPTQRKLLGLPTQPQRRLMRPAGAAAAAASPDLICGPPMVSRTLCADAAVYHMSTADFVQSLDALPETMQHAFE